MHIEGGAARPATGRACLVLALLLAAAVQAVVLVRSPAINKDGIGFIRFAQALRVAPVEAIRRMDQHPGYPALITLAEPLAGALVSDRAVQGWLLAARATAMLSGLLLIALVWLLARRVFDGRTAGLAALLFAALPLFRRNAADALSDSPHLVLYCLAVWAAVEGFQGRQWAWFLLAGTASGAAYAVRPEGLTVALVAAGLLGWMAMRERPRFHLACLVCVLASAGAVAAPYAVLKGKLTAKKDLTTYLHYRASAPADGPVQLCAAAVTAVPSKAAGGVVLEMAWRTAWRFTHILRYILVAPLVIAFLPGARRRAQADARRFVGAIVLFHLALLLILYATSGYLDDRHLMPLAILAMPWAAAGALEILDRLAARASQCRGAMECLGPEWSAGAVGVLVVLALAPRSLAPIHAERRPLIEAACRIRACAAPGDAVLSNSPYLSFYANLPGHCVRPRQPLPPLRTPEGRPAFRFVVLSQDPYEFDEEWLDALAPSYRRLPPVGKTKEWRRVVVLVGE